MPFAGSLRLLLATAVLALTVPNCTSSSFEEQDWGEGLRVLTTYLPEHSPCEHRATTNDVIHYHYVGVLADGGEEFGKSFDYNSPYIVSLGQGRIIPGMDRGLMDTCLWERRRITIPPHLGYGSRGVGSVIPPNSTLVFYIRLIKIERNGIALGEEQSIRELYDTALQYYTQQKWQETVDVMELALKQFYNYENQTFHCLSSCREQVGADLGLSVQDQELVDKLSPEDPLVKQFLRYAAQGKCVKECKMRTLSPNLRTPDSTVLTTFRRREPYSYLHFAYYSLENIEEGAKCLFTFYFYNPSNELALSNIPFYRKQLGLGRNEFSVFREPGILPHQEAYFAGKKAYSDDQWQEAVDNFERALTLYLEHLAHCQLMCEDILPVDLTQRNISEEKRAKYEKFGERVDAAEYYQLLAIMVETVMECRAECGERMATANGEFVEKYLSSHFDHLQFSYYKLGLGRQTAECVATHRAMEPTEHNMAQNVRFYTSHFKLEGEAFAPREEFVRIHQRREAEEELLYLSRHGHRQKRSGPRGDVAFSQQRHEEL